MPETPNTHAPWKLPVLVPLWIIQIALAILFLVGVPIVQTSSPEWRNRDMDLRTWLIIVFSVLNILINIAETILFTKHKLATRTYLISQWTKATMIGVFWVVMSIAAYTPIRGTHVGSFAITEFVFQHPAVLASVYYGSRVYSKYGGEAGAEGGGEGETTDEEAPLVRNSAEDA